MQQVCFTVITGLFAPGEGSPLQPRIFTGIHKKFWIQEFSLWSSIVEKALWTLNGSERVQNSTTHKDSCRWPKCGRNCRLFLVNYLFHVLHLHCIVINKLIFVKLFDLTKHVLSSKQGLARIKAFLLSPNLTVYSVNCTSVQYSYPPTLTAVLKGLWDEKVQL